MFTNQAWREIFNWTSNIVDILVLWFLIYYALKFVRNNTRTVQIFKGIILILAAKFFANLFGLQAVGWLADMFVSWGFVAVIIIFQPELRRMLDIAERDELEIFMENDRIVLQKFEPACLFCGSSRSLVSYRRKNVCQECVKKLIEY